MSSPRSALLSIVAALAAVSAVGCNAGGLLVAQDGGSGGAPAVLGPSVTEIVNGGTVAQNAKYKVVFTMGQPTPNQGPVKGAKNRLNGGIVGAMNGP